MAHPYDDEEGRWRADENRRDYGDRGRGRDEPYAGRPEAWRARGERDEWRSPRDEDRWREVGGGRPGAEDERTRWDVRPRGEDDRSREWTERGGAGYRGGDSRSEQVREGGDRGWPGGVRGSEGGAGYGRGWFGTAYGLYAGRPEHEGWRGTERGDRDRMTESQRRGREPKGYRRSDDRILDDIVERVMISGIDCGTVEVKVENGEVTLTGEVSHRHEKRRIEEACDDVRGVTDVHNQIRVSRGEDKPETGMH
jgi:hypothetical protein